jgi:transcriptional regulator with XRE-family HTH domain
MTADREVTHHSIATRLKFAREEAGVSTAQVAKTLDFQRAVLDEIELGIRGVFAVDLVRLAALYDVSPCWLMLGGTTVESEGAIEMMRRKTDMRTDDIVKLGAMFASMRGTRRNV